MGPVNQADELLDLGGGNQNPWNGMQNPEMKSWSENFLNRKLNLERMQSKIQGVES